MAMDTDRLRSLVARLVVFGDLQELMNLYSAADVSLSPEALADIYDGYDLAGEARQDLEEVTAAIGDDLLPDLEKPVTVPSEIVELTARCAIEHGKYHVAVRAFREAGALEEAYRKYGDYAAESLAAGGYQRAAWELILTGRLGWAQASAVQRAEFVVSLGINPVELGFALGAESSRGRLSGGRPLPDFPAWQTYGPLFHARCGAEGCVADMSVEDKVPLAIRYLIHDSVVAERALAAAGDKALLLLKELARVSGADLGQFADRHEQANARYLEVKAHGARERGEVDATEQSAAEDADDADRGAPDVTTEGDSAQQEPDEQPTDELDGASGKPQEARATPEALREGLREVQRLLLGRPESAWRNCLAQLAYDHPLSILTVCTIRSPLIGSYVVPVGEPGSAFLKAILG